MQVRKEITRRFILSGAIAMILAVSCGLASAFDNHRQQPKPPIAMGLTDRDTPIIVSPGAPFAIVMEANPTTGYSWQFLGPLDEKNVKLTDSIYIPPNSDLAGAGGKEVWTFVAVNPGKATISFQYARPWEKGVPPALISSFNVVIGETAK